MLVSRLANKNPMNTLKHIDQFIADMDRVDNLEELQVVLRTQIERLGFELFSYQLLWPPEGPRFPLYTTNYPAGWTKRYIEKKHISHDLVSRNAAVARLPFLWPEIPNLGKMTERQKLVFNESSEFGRKTGATVPINGPGLAKGQFTVANTKMSDEEFKKLFLLRRHEIHLIATYAHERILNIGLQNPPPAQFRLTPREVEIMTYTAQGKSAWDISSILNISEHTVSEHIENVCRKLGVYNKVHATAVSIIHGLITP